jgi:hypothetical protein
MALFCARLLCSMLCAHVEGCLSRILCISIQLYFTFVNDWREIQELLAGNLLQGRSTIYQVCRLFKHHLVQSVVANQ